MISKHPHAARGFRRPCCPDTLIKSALQKWPTASWRESKAHALRSPLSGFCKKFFINTPAFAPKLCPWLLPGRNPAAHPNPCPGRASVPMPGAGDPGSRRLGPLRSAAGASGMRSAPQRWLRRQGLKLDLGLERAGRLPLPRDGRSCYGLIRQILLSEGSFGFHAVGKTAFRRFPFPVR